MNDSSFHLMPDQASTIAPANDALFFYLVFITLFFTVLIFALIIFFGLKFRRKSEEMPARTRSDMRLELSWTIIPLLISLSIFAWSAGLFVKMSRPPANAMEIYVVGKQWMWKVQHPAGPREINELHIPVNRPIKLTMASEDVIHDFYIPAFRVKQDVVPGRYSYEWFTATEPGEYHLFCAEYCGKDHSRMGGKIVVMEESDYQAWLAGTGQGHGSAADAGAKLFQQYSCASCHGQKAPTMAGLYMSQRPMADGKTVVADENYLRESILNSSAKIVAGYPPIMPSFRGQLTPEQINELVEYIKSQKVPARNY